MSAAGLVLVGISGICWTIVYIELIRNGFTHEEYRQRNNLHIVLLSL